MGKDRQVGGANGGDVSRGLQRSGARCAVLLAAAILSGGIGCCSLPSARTAAADQRSVADNSATNAPAQRAVRNVPTVRPTTLQKLNPIFWFGNLDDPDPPDWYRPDDPRRDGKWYCRNSLHNFTFYVMGIADKEFEHTGRFPGELFNPNDGWNWTMCRYKCVRLPLISYKQGRFLFYAGWRTRGNFGLKLNFRNSHVK